jgi:hypothetical protein
MPVIKIVSWNTQGDGKATITDIHGRFQTRDSNTAYVIVNQESGLHGTAGVTPWSLGHIYYNMLSVETENDKNDRCSIMIAADVRLRSELSRCHLIGMRRPIVLCNLNLSSSPYPTRSSSLLIAGIHALSAGDSPATVDDVKKALGYIRENSTNWILIGDFNMSPSYALKNLGTNPFAEDINSSGMVTQKSGGELDWAICSVGSSYFQTNKLRVIDGGNSDHWPICLDVTCNLPPF